MGHKILLADDSITIQKVIELTFSDEDFELHTVGNGQKAIDEIRTIQPDIVLCDIIMPEKNGYEVCEFIKSTDELKHIPVLLLTGAFEPFDQERAKAAGCEGFLAKPFEPQTLISKVKELLAGAQPAPSQAAGQVPQAQPARPPQQPQPAPQPPRAPQASPARPAQPPQQAPPAPPKPAQPEPKPAGHEGDETVLVPPALSAPPPPVSAPQAPATPTPPPQETSRGLDEGFAEEAGERELSMDPGDHTMLLGSNDSADVPPAPPTPPGASDDIWSDVSASPPPMENQPPDDGSTVFMATPPEGAAEPEIQSFGESVDNEMSVESVDPDATWQMPPSSPDAPSSPEPGDDFGGFEDFAAPAPEPTPSPENVASTPSTSEPPLIEDPFTPAPPELGRTNEVEPITMSPEPIPSVDTEATIDPVLAGGEPIEPLSPPPSPEPPPLQESPPAEFTPVESEDELPTLEPAEAPEPEPALPSAPEPPVVEATPSPPPMAAEPEPVPQTRMGAPSTTGASASSSSEPAVDDDLVERVAQRVVDKLSSKIIQEIAWEVVPDLAEGLIQKEIDVLKSKLPKSG